jgi:hypothetical protein
MRMDSKANRREFLQIGVGASAWPLLSRAAHAAGLDRHGPSVRIATVVYDTRFAQSIAFADRCAVLGLTTRAIEADMTRLWYDEIYHCWQGEPAAIAGLTAYGPMFCFAELARDVRMRVVFRAEHRVGGGSVAHAITGPIALRHDAIAACRGTAFGSALADVVSRCPQGRAEIVSARIGRDRRSRPAEAGGHEEPDEDALYTWVIAPATPASSL